MADANLAPNLASERGDDLVKWGATPVSTISVGERRLEASTFLADGYGQRLSIEGRPAGWQPVAEVANVWQPSRLKGITVPGGTGTPFLAAGQVYERHPVARKWLSLDKTPDFVNRFVDQRTILLTCSGSVGRATVAHAPHAGSLITHDLLRIQPLQSELRGWTYAYMRTALFRKMALSSHYGHMIKHLEPSHVAALPIVVPPPHEIDLFQARFERIFSARDEAWHAILQAHSLFTKALAPSDEFIDDGKPFSIHISAIQGGRRRLDAYHRNRTVQWSTLR